MLTTEIAETTAVSPRLSVHILATTAEGTLRALTSAKRLTDGLGARIVLLVPRVTSLAVPFDPAGDDRAVIVDEYRALAASVGAHVTVLSCIAR